MTEFTHPTRTRLQEPRRVQSSLAPRVYSSASAWDAPDSYRGSRTVAAEADPTCGSPQVVGGHLRTLAQPRSNRRGVNEPTFTTPEEAAVADFPPQYVRVDKVSYSQHGRRAKVTLLTNEQPYLYPCYVYCEP